MTEFVAEPTLLSPQQGRRVEALTIAHRILGGVKPIFSGPAVPVDRVDLELLAEWILNEDLIEPLPAPARVYVPADLQ